MYDDVQKTGGWIFVIDTDQYAGNFEREMTAYITGQVGECEVGSDMFEYYIAETGDKDKEKFSELLEHRADDHGCHRPCTIYSTPGWFNNGSGEHFKETKKSNKYPAYLSVAIFFYEKPSAKIISFMKERAKRFAATKRKMAKERGHSWDENFKLEITGFRLIEETLSTKEEVV